MAGAMRRPVLRILFNAATVLSLVLCAVAVGLWWWGRSSSLWVSHGSRLSLHSLNVSRGELCAMAIHRFDPLYPYPYSALGWKRKIEHPAEDLLSAQELFSDASSPSRLNRVQPLQFDPGVCGGEPPIDS
jgi:hypothetical protein